MIDTHIPAWQLLLAVVTMAASWAVAMNRINTLLRHDKQHFDHAADRAIHQMGSERQAAMELVSTKLKAHEDLDEMQFTNLERRLNGIESKLDRLIDLLGKRPS